jgi:hypothetical protein
VELTGKTQTGKAVSDAFSLTGLNEGPKDEVKQFLFALLRTYEQVKLDPEKINKKIMNYAEKIRQAKDEKYGEHEIIAEMNMDMLNALEPGLHFIAARRGEINGLLREARERK